MHDLGSFSIYFRFAASKLEIASLLPLLFILEALTKQAFAMGPFSPQYQSRSSCCPRGAQRTV